MIRRKPINPKFQIGQHVLRQSSGAKGIVLSRKTLVDQTALHLDGTPINIYKIYFFKEKEIVEFLETSLEKAYEDFDEAFEDLGIEDCRRLLEHSMALQKAANAIADILKYSTLLDSQVDQLKNGLLDCVRESFDK